MKTKSLRHVQRVIAVAVFTVMATLLPLGATANATPSEAYCDTHWCTVGPYYDSYECSSARAYMSWTFRTTYCDFNPIKGAWFFTYCCPWAPAPALSQD